MSETRTVTMSCEDYPTIESMQKELQYQSFRMIRHFTDDFETNPTNDEIAGFVKGICALEREISMLINRKMEIR